MSLARIHIAAFLLVLGLCNAERTTGSREIKVNDSGSIERTVADAPKPDVASDEDDEAEVDEEEDEREEDSGVNDVLPPILPPIILLDFGNDTSDVNATADEKSKRTVNDGLGYGFGRNSLVSSRKYNYYFPAGKTGTTVSIEESISPFLPRTIIERVPAAPSDPKVPTSASLTRQRDSQRTTHGASGTSYQYYSPTTEKPVFGLRTTKLTKTSEPPETFGGFSPIARPVGAYTSADYRESAYGPVAAESSGYATPSPPSYSVSSSSRYAYVTQSPASYSEVRHPNHRYPGQSGQHVVHVQSYARPAQNGESPVAAGHLNAAAAYLETQANSHDYVRAGSSTVESSTAASPGDASDYAAESAGGSPYLPPGDPPPRYTVENGVRYENKIFWKYPDGRVSHVPPMTYETYAEYPSLAALEAATRTQGQAAPIYEAAGTGNGDASSHNQGPVQFPTVPDSAGPPTPFISAESLSSLSQQHAYRLGYQSLISSQKQQQQQAKAGSGLPAPPKNFFRSSGKSRYETTRRPPSKYMVNSPNPEYVHTTESSLKSSGSIISSAGGHSAKKTNAGGKNLEGYSNLQYADLLNYNPSISQYIKNPASILNVQPTFVQAGSSLIPVIILRVDGVPPIQPKATPNVNLKALLQQYLIQYAKSIEELARPSSYDLGNDQMPKDQSSYATSPLRQLARLAQNDGHDLVGNPTESYVGKTSYETSNLGTENGLRKYGERTAARPKVKSVQIVEDPRFPNYRIKN